MPWEWQPHLLRCVRDLLRALRGHCLGPHLLGAAPAATQYPESTSALIQKIAELQRAAGLEGVLVDPYARASELPCIARLEACSASDLRSPARAGWAGQRAGWAVTAARPAAGATIGRPLPASRMAPAAISVRAGTGVTVTGWAALACMISLVLVTMLAGVVLVRRITGQDKPHTQYVKSGDA